MPRYTCEMCDEEFDHEEELEAPFVCDECYFEEEEDEEDSDDSEDSDADDPEIEYDDDDDDDDDELDKEID